MQVQPHLASFRNYLINSRKVQGKQQGRWEDMDFPVVNGPRTTRRKREMGRLLYKLDYPEFSASRAGLDSESRSKSCLVDTQRANPLSVQKVHKTGCSADRLSVKLHLPSLLLGRSLSDESGKSQCYAALDIMHL